MFSVPSNIQEGKPISIAKLLLNGDAFAPNRNFLFTENCENGEASCTFAVLNTSDWRNKLPKLVCNTPSCVPEFYDVKSDPFERENLANLPDYEQPIAQMLESRRGNRIALKA